MKIIVCLDDKNGMMFNGRRQSKDRVLVEKIIEMTRDDILWLHPYSMQLFDERTENLRVDEKFLELAKKGEYCFVEAQDVKSYADSIEEIIIFRWNRVYPADSHFPVEMLDNFKIKGDSTTFSGKSHEIISVEVYSK